MINTLVFCEMCGQLHEASEKHECMLKPSRSNIINEINKVIESANKPKPVMPWPEKWEKEIRADERRKFAEWIVKGFSVNEEHRPGEITERRIFLVNSYSDGYGYCRFKEENILSSEDIVNEYEKEQTCTNIQNLLIKN